MEKVGGFFIFAERGTMEVTNALLLREAGAWCVVVGGKGTTHREKAKTTNRNDRVINIVSSE